LKVFLTGASSGIGAALAKCYADQGATLGLVARRDEKLRELVQTLPSNPAAAHQIYPLDVTDSAALRAAALDFIARVGIPDIVIANAGISTGILTEYPEDLDVFRRIINTNLLAMAATFQPFIAPMREAVAAASTPGEFRPRLVGIASVAGVRGLPGSGAYCASKAGVISYCESLRVELRGAGIRVVTLLPGFVASPMTAENPYPMPFLMPAERFARQATRAIEAGVRQRVIPWPMGVVAAVLRRLPDWLYDSMFANAKHKPRQKD